MASGQITVEVKAGPAFVGVMSAIEMINEAMDLVPDWHGAERDALSAKAEELKGLFKSLVMQDKK